MKNWYYRLIRKDTPINTPTSRNKDANLEKLKEREDWYKLVVKIISWSDEALASSQIVKISPKEWRNYYNGIIKTNVVSGKEKTTAKLKEIKEIIERNGGFEQ